ncbi:MAG: AAA family ATPase [Bacteroidetes bacterium]|nr:MAG: AAA family ATPase [Bacteroidota bacterium]
MQVARPFVFGTSASGENFTDRVEETAHLLTNFRHGINTILISPRRWGKTSLVRRAVEQAQSSDLLVVYLDIFSCRDEEDFYRQFARAVLKQTANRLEEYFAHAKDFLARLSPSLSLGDGGGMDVTLALDFKGEQPLAEDVLNLPEKIAQRKACRIVVCIDEFQQIGEFRDAMAFQKRLRSVWQLQQSTSYCLFGSRKHLMHELFEKSDLPFYKFGDTLHLERIPAQDWVDYICLRFQKTGKSIPSALASRIAEVVDRHSSYVQQLAWLVWVQTQETATEEQFEAALQRLLEQNSPLFEKQTEGLSSYQLNFLKAVLDGHTEGLAKRELIEAYRLGSSANVSRVKGALLGKELIDQQSGAVFICDPLLRVWLRERLFT